MHSRGEALPLTIKTIRAEKALAKGSQSVNAGRKAMKLKMAESMKLADSKIKQSKSKKPHRAKPPRAANAAHTRPQGVLSDPPVQVRLWRQNGL